MDSADICIGGPRLPWAELLGSAVGHAAVIAALMPAAGPSACPDPGNVLVVRWIAEQGSDAMPSEQPTMSAANPTAPRSEKSLRNDSPHISPAEEVPAVPSTSESAPLAVTSDSAPAGTSGGESAPFVPPLFSADYLSNPPPDYPPASRATGEHGKVLLDVQVSPTGEALDVQLHTSCGFERLDAAALNAVRRWKFAPARRGAEAVAAWVVVPILFSLRR